MRRSIAQAVPHDAARLIAVSKTVGVDETVAAIQAGYRHFAENRPQELVRKLTGLAEHPELPEVHFDMIGNLQTNKINAVLGSAELIHSVVRCIWRRRSRAVLFARLRQASSSAPSVCSLRSM